MPKVHYVKAARKAYPEAGIQIGEPYYWWKPRWGPKRKQKTPPKRSQLTGSAYLSWLYDFQDETLANFQPKNKDDFEARLEEIKQEISAQKEEQEEKLDNMPEQLQEADSGQMIQERIDALENAESELDSIDVPDPEDYDDTEEWQESFNDSVEQVRDIPLD